MRKFPLLLAFLSLFIGCNQSGSPKIIESNEAYSLINNFIIDSLHPINLFAIETIKIWDLDLNPDGPPKGAPYYISYNHGLLDSLIKNNIIDKPDREIITKQLNQKEEYIWDYLKIHLRTLSIKFIDQYKSDNPNDGPWDKIEKIYGSSKFIILSAPIFIHGNDTILISVNRICNGLCGDGQFIVFKKINNKWVIIYKVFTWTS